MPNITYNDKSDGDFFTSQDANEIKSVVNLKKDSESSRGFSSTITFDVDFRSSFTQIGDINFTLNSTGNVDGVIGKIIVTGDSTGAVTFPSGWVKKNETEFDNTKVNIIELEYETKVFYSIFN